MGSAWRTIPYSLWDSSSVITFLSWRLSSPQQTVPNHIPEIRMKATSVIRCALLSAALLLGTTHTSSAQPKISLGPQVTTMGVGLGLSVKPSDRLSLSAEYNYFPIEEITEDDLGSTLRFDPDIQGGTLMVLLHPFASRFALGAGIQIGGITADGELELTPGDLIDLDGTEYTVDQLDTFTADFNFGDMKPAFLIGWVGQGFNFMFGAAIASPELELEATGILAQIPQFQADLQAEVDRFNEDLGSFPVYPLVRLGWQFGF